MDRDAKRTLQNALWLVDPQYTGLSLQLLDPWDLGLVGRGIMVGQARRM
jgi:hypothetical protein